MARCSTCDNYMFTEHHRCPPAWKCGSKDWEGDDESQYGTFYADSPDEAAAAWGDRFDSHGDYIIVSGRSMKCVVIGEDGARHLFEVTGEAIPSYYARKLAQATE